MSPVKSILKLLYSNLATIALLFKIFSVIMSSVGNKILNFKSFSIFIMSPFFTSLTDIFLFFVTFLNFS